MFCRKCGAKIPDNSKFCSKCGVSLLTYKVNSTISLTSSDIVKKNHLRDALLIYLDDLRVMEIIIQESNDRLEILNRKEAEYKEKYLCQKNSIPYEPIMPEEPGKRIGIFGIVISIVLGVLLCCTLIGVELGIMAFEGIYDDIKYDKKDKEDYLLAMENYNNYCIEYKQLMIEYNANCAKYEKMLNEFIKKKKILINKLNFEIEKTENILNKAYAINIIPSPFRNIDGVMYLYDYLSTSNESLSDALLHCDLDKIRVSIEKMIELQKVSIVQQAQMNAKLDDIRNQNEQILFVAQENLRISKDIFNNSAETEKYARISAVNSELSVELQRKQLAYQEVDFWLN